MYGVQKSHHQQRNKAALEEFTSPMEVVPFDLRSRNSIRRNQSSSRKKGAPIGSLYTMITAHSQ